MAHSVESLPKWAQDIINRQQRTIHRLQDDMDLMLQRGGESGHVIVRDPAGDHSTAINPNRIIRFTVGETFEHIDARIELPSETGQKPSVLIRGSGPIMVVPEVANTVRIVPRAW